MSIYVLDTNFFVQRWTYYNPKYTSNYWEIIAQLGKAGSVIVPDEVYNEIDKKEDQIKEYLNRYSDFRVYPNRNVQEYVKDLLSHPKHKALIEEKKGRSLGDPWVIAHAQDVNGTVVTKEVGKRGLRIPDVCDELGVKCIDDFEFIEEVGIFLSAEIKLV